MDLIILAVLVVTDDNVGLLGGLTHPVLLNTFLSSLDNILSRKQVLRDVLKLLKQAARDLNCLNNTLT